MVNLAYLLALCLVLGVSCDRLAQHGTLQEKEEAAARETFKAAVPFLDSLVQDLAKVQQSLKRADQALIQVQAKAAPKTVLSKGSPAKAKKKSFDVQGAVVEMGKLGPKQMPQMLGLVGGMYDAWKDKISAANAQEQEAKAACAKEISDLEAKKRKYKNDANATAEYDRIEKYWKRQREISHRQFHTSLKIMHSGMEKFKTVMNAMKDAVAGKKPTQAELRSVGQLMPEVVLLQTKMKDLRKWSVGAISILRDARNPHPGMGTYKVR